MIHKRFLKTKCQITFSVADNIAEAPKRVYLVSDFNQWDEQALPMNKKGREFAVTVDLDLDHSYQSRYLVNGQEWHNDPAADSYAPNEFGSNNSVVTTWVNREEHVGKTGQTVSRRPTKKSGSRS